jgi:hypothetical protein
MYVCVCMYVCVYMRVYIYMRMISMYVRSESACVVWCTFSAHLSSHCIVACYLSGYSSDHALAMFAGSPSKSGVDADADIGD